MQFTELLTKRDDAVSPVIGVILMIAITVILAAVVASFVLSIGPGAAAPTITFDSEFDESPDPDELIVEVGGGDSVPAGQLSLSSGEETVEWEAGNADGTGPTASPSAADSEVSAGSVSTVDVSGPDYEVDVIWESADGGTTQTLATFEG